MAKEGVAVGDIFTLDHLKHFIEEAEEHASLTAEEATSDVGNNTLKNFLIVNRKLKLYDADVGPYDAVKLFVTEDAVTTSAVRDAYSFSWSKSG